MSKLIANADDYSTEEIDAKFAKMSAECAKEMDGTPSKKTTQKTKKAKKTTNSKRQTKR